MAGRTQTKVSGDEIDVVGGACLVLITRGVGHGYDVARYFEPTGELGPVLTLSRPVVYRAIKSLEQLGLVTSSESLGSRGQLKWQLTATAQGRRVADEWLGTPVDHLRDMRVEFLVKYILVSRTPADARSFVGRQRQRLEEVTAALVANRSQDPVAVWRREQARAALRFLDELEGQSTEPTARETDAPTLQLSARNQLRATVKAVKHGDVLSSVRLALEADQTMTATITREAVDDLRLAPGSSVLALCKATDVMVAVDQSTIA